MSVCCFKILVFSNGSYLNKHFFFFFFFVRVLFCFVVVVVWFVLFLFVCLFLAFDLILLKMSAGSFASDCVYFIITFQL